MRISIVGTGYVGLVTGTCFAELGNDVVMVDVIQDKVDKINRGIPPIYEEGLDRMLRDNLGKGRLHATLDIDKAVKETDITFISVGTPSKKDGSIDMVYIKKASEAIGNALRGKRGYHTIVVKSTVVPQTTEKVVIPIIEKRSGKKAGREFGVAMNPEFLREGFAIKDFMNPDRVVIGAIDKKSADTVYNLYRRFDCKIMKTDTKTAEMIKYASNAFLATKISFSNELGNMCKKLGIDSYAVADGMGLDSRIERRFLNSGIGYGGSCFPKDVKAFVKMARKSRTRPVLLDAVEKVNKEQPLKIMEILRKRMPTLKGKTVAVLGLAFKDGTDDIREAPSLKIVGELKRLGAFVKAYDPQASENFKKQHPRIEYCSSARSALEGSDAALVVTEWPEFSELTDDDFKRMKGDVIIEGRRILKKENVKKFEGVCW
jgi:UDPglucose 6-dehydrogenase